MSVAGIIGLSSCSKCYTCTKSGVDDVEICKDDMPTGYGSLDAWKDYYEALGYDCKK
ncbi:MAG: hypothetical protein KDE33_10480 [Bacteroidetes bacterium]|nr:hypothetical protein [Bacteroidota bacterium]MCB9226048.1 hypothetical protein [Chitinophagales bacterium]